MIRRLALVVGLAVTCMALSSPVYIASAQGNHENAHRCQNGGWETLAPAENPVVPFANQGACVSYGAQGGVIVALVTAHVDVTIGPPDDNGVCLVTSTLVTGQPGVKVDVHLHVFNGGNVLFILTSPADTSYVFALSGGASLASGTAELLANGPTGVFIPVNLPTAACGA